MSSGELFGADPDSVAEIDAVLASPDCSVAALLRCRSLVNLFRAGHPGLAAFLKSEPGMRQLLHLIHTTGDRKTQATLLSLFQTSNTGLHRALAESITLTDYAITVLNDRRDVARFSVGVISRIVAKAFDLWPDDMCEIFRLSKHLYPNIVQNIDRLCVFHCAQTLVTVLHGDAWLFVWRCWLVAVWPAEFRLETKYVPEREPIDRSVITKRHVSHILELMRLFLKSRRDDEEREIAERVLEWVRTTEITADVLRLALVLEKDAGVAKRVVQFVTECKDFMTEVFWMAVEYLAYCCDECTIGVVCGLLCVVLGNPEVTVFARTAAKNLLAAKAERNCAEVQSVIASAFMTVKDDPQLRPFVFACALALDDSARVKGWQEFRNEVLEKWEREEPWNEEFQFTDVEKLQDVSVVLINV